MSNNDDLRLRMQTWIEDNMIFDAVSQSFSINTKTNLPKKSKKNSASISYMKLYADEDAPIQKDAFKLPSMFTQFLDDLYINQDAIRYLVTCGDTTFSHFMFGESVRETGGERISSGLFVIPKFFDADSDAITSYKKNIKSVVKAHMIFKGHAVWDNPRTVRKERSYHVKSFTVKQLNEGIHKRWLQISHNKWIDTDVALAKSAGEKGIKEWTPTHLAYTEGSMLFDVDGTPLITKDVIGEAIKAFREMKRSDWTKWKKNLVPEKYSGFNDEFLE